MGAKSSSANRIFKSSMNKQATLYLWQVPLIDLKTMQDYTLLCNNAYDLQSVEATVKYLHAAARFAIKSTWLKAKKKWNFCHVVNHQHNNCQKVLSSWGWDLQRTHVPTMPKHLINQTQKHPECACPADPCTQWWAKPPSNQDMRTPCLDLAHR